MHVNRQTTNTTDWFQILVTYGVAALVFSPVLLWLGQQAQSNEQIRQALVILLGLGAFLAWENGDKLRPSFSHDRISLGLILASFLLVGLQVWWHTSALIMLAFLLAIAALLRFTFGRAASVATWPLLCAFGLFTLIVLFLPAFDWPLRLLAGKWSAALLGGLGGESDLRLVTQPEPFLLLTYAGRPFMVAAECNGFGLLSSMLLVSVTLGIYRRIKRMDFVLMVVAASCIALVANFLRIVFIVLLAPRVTNYDLMHEIVGTVCFYLAILGAGWLVWTSPHRRNDNSHAF